MSTNQQTDIAAFDGHRDSVNANDLRIRQVEPGAAMRWLREGWAAVGRAPGVSLFYGGLCAAVGFGVVLMSQAMPGLTVKFIIALLLLGPFLAAGLHVNARQHHAGEATGIWRSFALDGQRRSSLALFGLLLIFVVATWMMATVVLFAIKVTALAPTSAGYVTALGGGADPLMTLFLLVSGALLAGGVFVSSVIAVPLIVDRDAGPVAAAHASWRAVAANPRPMLAWAGVVVGLMLLGALSAFLAMALIFPLLGYGSWYAYRELIEA
ncbi:DUF2189 domain-containing protein [Thiohalocapsa sp. ML1]|jgi:uncharacterized membrane protein|uniref:DUF2189 domain-containing protein n=1 Tax=Thiohalocapsa sp. ML1 TaxID=1431688 RepID=UPI0007324391|nr:DUF2189 domain-containing protein [Thiohalocapsa sp. ML1]